MFDHPSQAEPYVVPFSGELRSLAHAVVESSRQLMRSIPYEQHSAWWQIAAHSNARYSNLLEGEERVKFVETHKSAEGALDRLGCVGGPGLGSAALQDMHKELYLRVNASDVEPGILRRVNVTVQRHVPPRWESVPAFLKRTDEVFLQKRRDLEELLIVTAVAHHRMQWIHPFPDGNGRAIRLQSQLVLRPLASHFWSLSQGLWHQRKQYYEMLAAADSPRLSDLDGRGNLSQKRLEEWAMFFISVCHGEIMRQIGHLS